MTDALDDLAPVIGYRATRVVVAWFAGRCMTVPVSAAAGHPLKILMGGPAFRALVSAFGGQALQIPSEAEDLPTPDQVRERWEMMSKAAAAIRRDDGVRRKLARRVGTGAF